MIIVYCYLEFKLRYLKKKKKKKLKKFSIRVKDLLKPIVLRKKKADEFLLFLKVFS